MYRNRGFGSKHYIIGIRHAGQRNQQPASRVHESGSGFEKGYRRITLEIPPEPIRPLFYRGDCFGADRKSSRNFGFKNLNPFRFLVGTRVGGGS